MILAYKFVQVVTLDVNVFLHPFTINISQHSQFHSGFINTGDIMITHDPQKHTSLNDKKSIASPDFLEQDPLDTIETDIM